MPSGSALIIFEVDRYISCKKTMPPMRPVIIHIFIFTVICTTLHYVGSLSFTLTSSQYGRHVPSRVPFSTTRLFYKTESSSAVQNSSDNQKRSRPERKAAERERKQQNQVSTEENKINQRRKHNYKQRETLLLSKDKTNVQPNKKSYHLHSTHVSVLNANSTANEVLTAIKRAQNLHDVHDIRNIERFLLEEVDESFAFGYRGSILARLAVAALHMNQHDLARRACTARRLHHHASILPMESAAIVRGLLRVHNM